MAAKIKLQRKGTKKKPVFRVIVQDESSPTKGMAIDILGSYEPRKEPTALVVDKEKAAAWLKKGAEPTEKVRILFGKAGIMAPVDLAALTKRKPRKEEKAAKEAAKEAAKAAKTEAKAEEAKPAEAKPEEAKA